MRISQNINPPLEYYSLSAKEQAELVHEVNRIGSLKKISIYVINASMFKDYFLAIHTRMQLTSYKQTVYHALDKDVPVCTCGTTLRWNGNSYYTYCSSKCANNSPEVRSKIEMTCDKRYGGISPANSSEVVDKMKRTNIERYGVESVSELDSVKDKKRESSMQKFGTSCPLQSSSVKDKTEKTMLDRYGVTHPAQSPAILEKIKTTTIDKYGVDNVSKSPEIQQRIETTFLAKYGVKHPTQSVEVVEKIKQTYSTNKTTDGFLQDINERRKATSMKTYGVEHHRQASHSKEAREFLDNDDLFTSAVTTTPMNVLAKQYGISPYPIYSRMKKLGLQPFRAAVSEFELEVRRFVSDNYRGEIIHNSRDIIPPKELDIYVPELNFAIECNGSYWHSELNGKDRGYHNDKTNKCLSSGITLFHLWEHDWIHRGDIIRSMLLSRLKQSHRIYARKCMISKITAKQADEFFEENHLQGTCASTVRYGLFYQDELVAAITFGKPRYNKAYEWELLRLAAKKNTTVVGGAGKLFKEFMYYYSPSSVISYSNRMSGSGNVYRQLGFNHTGISAPGYYYTNDYNEYHHRSKFQKHKLAGLGLEVDDKLTEWQIMQNNGYDRYHDSGNDVFAWNSDTA